MKIKMVNESQGIPSGTVLEVSDDRAERWCFVNKCAVFVDQKDKKTIEKKIDDAKEAAKKREDELDKKLKEMDEES